MSDHNIRTVPYKAASHPFAGRLGGNQEFVLDRNDPQNASILEKFPDAAPHMTLRQSFDLRGFRETLLWKAAVMEGMLQYFSTKSTLLLVYATSWVGLSPSSAPLPDSTASPAGVFDTTAFLGPFVNSIVNVTLLSLFIICFAGVSGGHLNSLITIGTFFSRLTTFPRLFLYLAFQIIGATLAGLLLRASFASRDFKVGGCFLLPTSTATTTVGSAFAIEFVSDLALLFLAFGVGLDPRQRAIMGPTLAPIFVGVSVGTLSLATSFTRPGFSGASLNPTRCFAVHVGSHFPASYWIDWVACIAAAALHGILYSLIPPWANEASSQPPPRLSARSYSETGPVKQRIGQDGADAA